MAIELTGLPPCVKCCRPVSVEELGAVAAAGVTYIPPVVALVIGAFLAGDKIHPLGYLAMVLILSGVALLQYGSQQASVFDR